MAKHTHVLAQPHEMIVDGIRKRLPAGAPVSPSPRALKNMPDVFIDVASGKPAPAAPVAHGMKGKSVGQIKDEIAAIEDVATIEEMLLEEEAGRARKTAVEALEARRDTIIEESAE